MSMTGRRRISALFSTLENARAFAASLPRGSEPTVIESFNAEDKARGYENPRLEWCKVAYWSSPMPFTKGTYNG